MKDEEPLFLIDRKPDRQEIVIRAICGGLLGVLLAAYAWVRIGGLSPIATLFLFLGFIVISALLAARFGDRYWEGLARDRPRR